MDNILRQFGTDHNLREAVKEFQLAQVQSEIGRLALKGEDVRNAKFVKEIIIHSFEVLEQMYAIPKQRKESDENLAS